MNRLFLRAIPVCLGMALFIFGAGLQARTPAGFKTLEKARLKASAGQWKDAIELYQRYLKDNHLDQGAQSELKDAEQGLEREQGPERLPGPVVPSTGFNGKNFQVQFRAISPIFASVEISALFARRWDLGVGTIHAGGEFGDYLGLYPRVRYHFESGELSYFIEAGVPLWWHWSRSPVAYTGALTDFIGGSFALGTAHYGLGWFTIEYYAGISAGSMMTDDGRRGARRPAGFSKDSSFLMYPFIGIGVGFGL